MARTAEVYSIARVITREEVDQYAELTGDHNPIHFGENAIVHGGLLIGRISAMVWRAFGDGTMARGIDKLRFDRPIHPGEQFFISLGDPVPFQGRTRLGEQTVQVTVTKICDNREKNVASGEIIIVLST